MRGHRPRTGLGHAGLPDDDRLGTVNVFNKPGNPIAVIDTFKVNRDDVGIRVLVKIFEKIRHLKSAGVSKAYYLAEIDPQRLGIGGENFSVTTALGKESKMSRTVRFYSPTRQFTGR